MGGDAGKGITEMAASQREADVRNERDLPAKESFRHAAGFARTYLIEFDYFAFCAVSAGASGAGKEGTTHREGKNAESKELDFF